ncbi:hypothetical protein DYB30_013115 [Aphanomyces astaci]|uniref:Uncharacterized protein n=1 Tax=Aphanomyces astaci TaxID=112090 RepID=A0A397CE90_APHAT|nr:hypothetical protein DYB30_013115 [Aphanomyces astaci]
MDDSVVQAVEAMYASSSTGQTRSAADAFLRSFQTSPNAFAVSHAFLANAPTTARVVQLFAAQTISHLTLTPAQVSQLSSLFSLHHHERDIVRLLGTALVRNMEAGQGLDWLIQGPWDADVRISLLTLAAVESVAYTEAQNVIVYLGSSHAATKDTLLCMAEWVKLLDRDARHPDLVIKNPLTTYAIQVLHRGLDDTSDLFDAAVDLVVEVIRTYNSTLVDLPVIQWLIPQLMQLKPLFTAAAAQGRCMAFPDPERTSLHLSYRILVPLPDSFVSATEFRSATEFFRLRYRILVPLPDSFVSANGFSLRNRIISSPLTKDVLDV